MSKPMIYVEEKPIRTIRMTTLHFSTSGGPIFDPGICIRYYSTFAADTATGDFGSMESNIKGSYLSGNIHVSPRKRN